MKQSVNAHQIRHRVIQNMGDSVENAFMRSVNCESTVRGGMDKSVPYATATKMPRGVLFAS